MRNTLVQLAGQASQQSFEGSLVHVRFTAEDLAEILSSDWFQLPKTNDRYS